jgi:cytidine deaminase
MNQYDQESQRNVRFGQITSEDEFLIKIAKDLIVQNFCRGAHHVGAAVSTKKGRVFTGLHLDSPGIDICAEAIAVGSAISAGARDLDTIVAVALDMEMNPQVLPPCGLCRELLLYHAPDISVIVPDGRTLLKAPIRELLPLPYRDLYRPISRDPDKDYSGGVP